MRWAAVGVLVTLVAVAACSDAKEQAPAADNALGYCKQLETLPDGLQNAVSHAALGSASDGDKSVIVKGANQLKAAAADKSAPPDARTVLTGAAAVLDKLAQGGQPSDTDVSNFGKVEETVNACVRK